MRSPLSALVIMVFAGSVATGLPQRETQAKPAVPAIGDWRSQEQFENQPRATVVVHDDSGTLAGLLTLLGMTRGADDRATLRAPFRDAAWDGTTLTFETVLPDNEGKARWALRLTTTGKATLSATNADGKPVEDGPMWEMVRQ